MKKQTVKQKLVDFMIAQGNPGFTYKQVIERLLKFERGEDYQYNWRSSDRGWFSDAFFSGNGYFLRGCGNCGLYKENGKYYAKYYDKHDMVNYATSQLTNKLFRAAKRHAYSPNWYNQEQFYTDMELATKNFKRFIERVSKLETS